MLLSYYNNLYYVQPSNIILGPVTNIAVHLNGLNFLTVKQTFLLLHVQYWLYPYIRGFCNLV